jgi:uncharacterized membrane protein (DUF106 family)
MAGSIKPFKVLLYLRVIIIPFFYPLIFFDLSVCPNSFQFTCVVFYLFINLYIDF